MCVQVSAQNLPSARMGELENSNVRKSKNVKNSKHKSTQTKTHIWIVTKPWIDYPIALAKSRSKRTVLKISVSNSCVQTTKRIRRFRLVTQNPHIALSAQIFCSFGQFLCALCKTSVQVYSLQRWVVLCILCKIELNPTFSSTHISSPQLGNYFMFFWHSICTKCTMLFCWCGNNYRIFCIALAYKNNK